jgi:hypothetical protein
VESVAALAVDDDCAEAVEIGDAGRAVASGAPPAPPAPPEAPVRINTRGGSGRKGSDADMERD